MSYFTIPSFIVDNKDLSLAEKFLYGYFHTHHFNGNTIFVSNAKLADMCNCKERQVQNLLLSLEKKKYIFREEKNIKGKNRRIIVPVYSPTGQIVVEDEDIHNHPAKNCTPTLQKIAPPPCKKLHTERKEEIKEEKKACASAGGSFNSSITDEERKAMTLLREKLNDNRITLKQTRNVLSLHSDKSVDLEWSINNFLYDISNQEENIRNKVAIFISRLDTENRGYYPDNKVYTKHVDKSRSAAPEGLAAALMANDMGTAKKIAEKASEKKPYAEAQQQAYEYWVAKKAHASEKDRFHGKPAKLFEYFVKTYWPSYYEPYKHLIAS